MHPWLYAGEHLQIPTYFASLMLGFSVATLVLRREALREGLAVKVVMDGAMWALPIVLCGARLAHALLVEPRRYLEHPSEILQIAYGGFVFYGGLLAGGLWLVRYSQHRGISPWRMGDIFAPATALGLVFGRIGCLGGGCCYGKPARWPFGLEIPWGVRYHHRGHLPDALLATSLHPAPLYEALFAIALFVYLSRVRARGHRPGEVLLSFVAIYGVGRSLIEIVRADPSRGLYFGGWLSTSQIIGLSSAAICSLLAAQRATRPQAR